MNISSVDKNLKVETEIKKDGLRFFNVLEKPFKVYGVFHDGKQFRRMPDDIAETVSPGVHYGSQYTAGGRVRFRTNSPYVAINFKGVMGRLPQMAFAGCRGFDLYIDTKYINSFVPPLDGGDGYESIIELGNTKEKEITINMPLYSFVHELYIGLDENSVIEAPTEYKISKPVVFYGSSITQGGCASRPGSCYQGYVTRRFDCDYINLGFSGNAKAEVEIAEYVASLDMSMFVYDYDHNSPSIEHLQETHERMFKIVREKRPDIPIILMSKPKSDLGEFFLKRLEIIRKTCENARANGDKNVYFLDGRDLFALCGDEGTVDGTHPTDYGFASMGRALCELIEKNNLL